MFPVKSYGAAGDGLTDDTDAIQRAIEDANSMGGGMVVLSGGVFLSGPIRLASRTCLQIDEDAILKMLPCEQYMVAGAAAGRYQPLVSAVDAHDVAVTGSGIIEGQGKPWWEKFRAGALPAKRPIMVMFLNCTRAVAQGVLLQNAPNVHLVVGGSSRDVTIEGVRVETTPASPNTDGFNIRGSNILVQKCIISCGDDNIALSGPTEGVTIRNCRFLRGHGLSIGSYTRGGLANMLVENCTFDGTETGLQGKSDRGRGGLVQNLSYSNISLTRVKRPIWFHSEYTRKMKDPNEEKSEPATDLTPVWRNVTFTNVTAIVPSKYPAGTLWGLPEAPIENFRFRNVNIRAAKGFEIYYAKDIVFDGDCSILPAKGEPFITFEATVEAVGKKQ
jgi:polygalacturonase